MIFGKMKFGCTSIVLFLCLTAGSVLRGQEIPSSPEQGDPTSPSEQETTEGRQVGEDRHVSSSASRNQPRPQPLSSAVGGVNQPDGARGYVQIGLSVTESYDDNVLQEIDKIPNALTSFLPFLNLERQGEVASTVFTYQGDGRIYNQNPELNLMGHRLGINQGFHGKRWSMRLAHGLSYSPDIHSALFTAQIGGGQGGAFPGDDTSLFTERNSRLINSSDLELQYRKSLRTSLTFSGSYRHMDFSGNGLLKTSSVGVRTAYSYRVSEKATVSIFPDARLLRFGGGLGTTNVYSLYMGYSYRQGKRTWISFRGGPQYADFTRAEGSIPSPDLVLVQAGVLSLPPSSRTNAGAGVNLSHNTRRAGIGIDYDRSINDSNGFGGAAETQTVRISLSVQRVKGWSTTLAGSFGRWRLFDLENRLVSSGRTGIRLERSVGEWAGLFISYQFMRQSTDLSGLSFTRNVGSVGIRWSSPRHRIR